jgi:hypothetical protein
VLQTDRKSGSYQAGLALTAEPIAEYSNFRVRNFAIGRRKTSRLTGQIGFAQN